MGPIRRGKTAAAVKTVPAVPMRGLGRERCPWTSSTCRASAALRSLRHVVSPPQPSGWEHALTHVFCQSLMSCSPVYQAASAGETEAKRRRRAFDVAVDRAEGGDIGRLRAYTHARRPGVISGLSAGNRRYYFRITKDACEAYGLPDRLRLERRAQLQALRARCEYPRIHTVLSPMDTATSLTAERTHLFCPSSLGSLPPGDWRHWRHAHRCDPPTT
jgi:hypothetical protein